MDERLGSLETNEIAPKATFLDPRLKKTGFCSVEHENKAEQFMTDELS